MRHPYDAVVVGGGPAACFVAAKISNAGARVALITGRRCSKSRPREIVSPHVIRILAAAGFRMPSEGATNCRGVLRRWSGKSPDFHDFELSACCAGLAVDRSDFHFALIESAAARGITVFRNVRVTSLLLEDNVAVIRGLGEIGDPVEFQCKWVVDACGRGGSICAPIDARRLFFDALVAVATNGPASRDVDYLIVEASARGWWYVCPSLDGSSQAVFLSDYDLIPKAPKERVAWLADEFESTSMISGAFAQVPDFQTSTVADARFSVRRNVFFGQWVAVGDAAIALDPLSGLGVYTALQGGDLVADGIWEALHSAKTSFLHNYAKWCRAEANRQAKIRREIYHRARSQIRKSIFWQRRQ